MLLMTTAYDTTNILIFTDALFHTPPKAANVAVSVYEVDAEEVQNEAAENEIGKRSLW